MSIFRAIFVAVVAFSVAVLPVAGGMARPASAEMSLAAVHADCCPQGTPCDKRASSDCGSVSGCALKCFSLSGVPVKPTASAPAILASEKPALLIPAVGSRSDNPPLPPPRV